MDERKRVVTAITKKTTYVCKECGLIEIRTQYIPMETTK